MTYENPLKRVWAEGRTAVNGWLMTQGVLAVEALAAAPWDSLTIDLQHGTANADDVLAMLPVIQRRGIAPIVRVPWNDPAATMRALDDGALGVICPMIQTVDDAARFVSDCLYPPLGARSYGPFPARYAWGDDYAATANAHVAPLAMIETKSALESLDAILDVEGLAGVYVGPSDLGSALGFGPAGDREEPELRAIIEDIAVRARKKGVAPCIHCGAPEYAADMASKGFSMVTIGSDMQFIDAGARDALARFKTAATS